MPEKLFVFSLLLLNKDSDAQNNLGVYCDVNAGFLSLTYADLKELGVKALGDRSKIIELAAKGTCQRQHR